MRTVWRSLVRFNCRSATPGLPRSVARSRVTFSGQITTGPVGGAVHSVVLSAAAGGVVEMTGGIRRAAGAGGSDFVTKRGKGMVILSGASDYLATHGGYSTFVADGAL